MKFTVKGFTLIELLVVIAVIAILAALLLPALKPVLQSGGTWNIQTEPHTYAGGMAYNGGVGSGGTNLWFREGLVVPEPSALALLLVGICGLLFIKRANLS